MASVSRLQKICGRNFGGQFKRKPRNLHELEKFCLEECSKIPAQLIYMKGANNSRAAVAWSQHVPIVLAAIWKEHKFSGKKNLYHPDA